MAVGPFTPTIRAYTRATSVEAQDAFELDRLDVGTMHIEAQDFLARCATYVIDGGGAVLSTGVAGALYIPFALTVESCTLLADQSGSVQIDIKAGAYSAYDTGTSIVGAAPPTITAALKAQDTTLTGWTTTLAADSFLQFSVTSVSTITRLTVALKVL